MMRSPKTTAKLKQRHIFVFQIYFVVWLIRSPVGSNVPASRIFIHGFCSISSLFPVMLSSYPTYTAPPPPLPEGSSSRLWPRPLFLGNELQMCFCRECRTNKNLPATVEIALKRLVYFMAMMFSTQ